MTGKKILTQSTEMNARGEWWRVVASLGYSWLSFYFFFSVYPPLWGQWRHVELGVPYALVQLDKRSEQRYRLKHLAHPFSETTRRR